MGTILDYLAWRGDLSFSASPFNEVDNLILAELAYTKMEEIVPGIDRAETVSIRDICREYERLQYKVKSGVNDAYPLLRAAAASARFSDVQAGAYVNLVDAEKSIQFSAVNFSLPDGSCYVAYRGTDNTIVGWREDFTISYLSETPGQYEAVRYLERIAARTPGPLLVGGHSKGGNLAMYAAAFCSEETQKRIRTVYSNDGPGFNSSVIDSPEYRAALPKVQLTIPESSVIGILLSNKEEKKTIKSTASGVQQHYPYTWAVLGTSFVEAENQSQASRFLDETLRRWGESLSVSEREKLVKALFDSMDAAGVQTFSELNEKRWTNYNAVFKAMREMDPSLQKEFVKTAKSLAAAGRDVLLEDAGLTFRETLAELSDQFRFRDE